jgi:hypothetical protein
MSDITKDTSYFTIEELETAFGLVTNSATAKRLAAIWRFRFADVVVGNRVIAIDGEPDLPRLASATERTLRDAIGIDTIPDEIGPHDHDLESAIGHVLVRFGPALDLLAGSDPAIRARFDRLGVPYARGTVSDPKDWHNLLEYLRRKNTASSHLG